MHLQGLSRALSNSPLDCSNRPGRKAAGRAVLLPCGAPGFAFRQNKYKKSALPFQQSAYWCTSRDSPAHFRTVRWTVRTGRDARRPDVLFSSLAVHQVLLSGRINIRKAPCHSSRALIGAPPGTRTLGPLIKSQLLSQLTNTNGVVKIPHVVLLPKTAYMFLAHGL